MDLIGFVIFILVMILADRSVATFARLYGGGLFRFSNEEMARDLSSRYGLFRFPRTVIAILSVVTYFSNQIFGIDFYLSMTMGCLLTFSWGAFAIFDIFEARRHVLKRWSNSADDMDAST